MKSSNMEFVILAAGGIIIRNGTAGPEVLVVHRNRYNDVSLPKGKWEIHETIEETALREVKEETGYDTIITGVAGVQTRRVNDKMKITVFFVMELTDKDQGPINSNSDNEVKEVLWLGEDELSSRVSYPEQTDIILKTFKKGL